MILNTQLLLIVGFFVCLIGAALESIDPYIGHDISINQLKHQVPESVESCEYGLFFENSMFF